jgi:hypothetical protein
MLAEIITLKTVIISQSSPDAINTAMDLKWLMREIPPYKMKKGHEYR